MEINRKKIKSSSYYFFPLIMNDIFKSICLSATARSSGHEVVFPHSRYLQLQQTYPWYSNITRRRQEIINRVKIQPDFDKATEYFYAMLGYLDALQKIQYEIRTRIEETILSEVLLILSQLCL